MGLQKDENGAWGWASSGTPPVAGGPPGWYDDPEAPGLERYWTGSAWHAEMPPRAKPTSALKQARIIALGILVALAAAYFVWNAQGPSDEECERQAFEVAIGSRLAVESGCR